MAILQHYNIFALIAEAGMVLFALTSEGFLLWYLWNELRLKLDKGAKLSWSLRAGMIVGVLSAFFLEAFAYFNGFSF